MHACLAGLSDRETATVQLPAWCEVLVACVEVLFFSAGVFIVAAKRTPFGTYGGVLRDHSATDLAEHAAKAALAAGGVAPELVNSVIFGNVMQVKK